MPLALLLSLSCVSTPDPAAVPHDTARPFVSPTLPVYTQPFGEAGFEAVAQNTCDGKGTQVSTWFTEVNTESELHLSGTLRLQQGEYVEVHPMVRTTFFSEPYINTDFNSLLTVEQPFIPGESTRFSCLEIADRESHVSRAYVFRDAADKIQRCILLGPREVLTDTEIQNAGCALGQSLFWGVQQ